MKSFTTHVIVGAVGAAMALSGGAAFAVNDQPLDENWAPSEWGADDMAGAVNRTTAAMVIKAAKLVKLGRVATLGKIYAGDGIGY